MNIFSEIWDSGIEVWRGLKITLTHLVKRPSITERYPEKPGEIFPRFRGRHALQRYEDGTERCIGCSLCAAVCPANAIYVVGDENDHIKPTSHGERNAKVYTINMLRCIYCGFCEEACPVEAVVLRHIYDFSSYSRENEIYTKDMLLDPEDKGFGENQFPGGMGIYNILDSVEESDDK